MPDIIFMDYEMPMVDGKNALEMIRQTEAGKAAKVVFLTGVTDKNRVTEVIAMNIDGYMVKPVSFKDIITTVQNLTKD